MALPYEDESRVFLFRTNRALTSRIRFKHEVLARKHPDLYVYGNGIDYKHPKGNRPTFDYEDHCFSQIISPEETDSLLIGPHIIDDELSKCAPELARPDAIRFDITDRERWIITDFFEFKSGKNLSIYKKLCGFSTLLKKLRNNTAQILNIFNSALPNAILLPSQIEVPPDNKITVTFISPNIRNETVFFGEVPPFPLVHIRIALAEND